MLPLRCLLFFASLAVLFVTETLASEDCGEQVLKQDFMKSCPEGYGFPASKAVCSAAAQAIGFDGVVGEEGPYDESHPPCLWTNPDEITWMLPGSCAEVGHQWNDIGAMCVNCCGGCFECMECDGMPGCPKKTVVSSAGETTVVSSASGVLMRAHMPFATMLMMVVAVLFRAMMLERHGS
eukprot:gnl/TRDRNA2_/TRDRNA2_74732_c0_seq1.p1 gnl/TRDRNA2_/TRDRNA2_74732_c0~~gnl/TRDRNA2_/TRDRNA2_74732_c0_seq1.p1  ORF type:complete len:180 (+),score=24.35 gnl/TRDRNA2_/TRDRNA2_74732_c0_seq1:63-602(+)